jgi:hypothetical protein
MKIDIFDVGRGACSVITCPDGRRLMIDCGSKNDPPYPKAGIFILPQSAPFPVVVALSSLRDSVPFLGRALRGPFDSAQGKLEGPLFHPGAEAPLFFLGRLTRA